MTGLSPKFLNTELIQFGKTVITPLSLLQVGIVLIVTLILSRFLRRIAERALDKRNSEARLAATLTSLVHYIVLFVGFGIAISTIGIDLTALFAAGAIFAIGLGFAMQSIAQNFVAGILLLIERAIKPGDIIEVDGRVMMVREMGIRASLVRSRDGEDIIIPNASLIQNQVKNFTMRDSKYRIRAAVRVRYSTDMALMRRLLTQVGEKIGQEWGHGDPPQILLSALGEHGAEWEVGVWISDPWERRPALDALYDAMWWALAEKRIIIAYPQLDLHLDRAALGALSQPESQKK